MGGEVITAPSNHQFWELADQNWTEAGSLGLDDTLLNIQDKPTTIAELRSYKQNTIVYNLTVANDHTYYVGLGGVLGHNAGCEVPQWNGKLYEHIFHGENGKGFHHRGSIRRPKSKILRISRKVTSGKWKGAYHADKVKIYDTGRIKESTFFPDSWTRSKVMDEINTAYINALLHGRTNGLVIEKSKNGYPIEMIINVKGLVTAYPKL